MKKPLNGCGTTRVTGGLMICNPWRAGLALTGANEGGSHHVFSFPGVEEDVCIPAHRPIKPVYVRQFVALVDKVKELPS